MKNRPARVRELIQRELGAVIAREMNFTTLVTVQAVDLTADFKHCHVHVGVLADEREQRDVIHALAEQRPHLQHELSRRVILKYTPRLHFHLDHSVERGTRVTEIMRQIDELTPPGAATADDAIHPRAAKDAIDMATQDRAQEARDQEEAARREIETDGADDEQDEIFEELTPAIEGEDEDTTAAEQASPKSEKSARSTRRSGYPRAARVTSDEDDQADE